MKRFVNLLKRLSLYDAEREATRGLLRHSENIKIELRHTQKKIEREEGREWSNETDSSHWTY